MSNSQTCLEYCTACAESPSNKELHGWSSRGNFHWSQPVLYDPWKRVNTFLSKRQFTDQKIKIEKKTRQNCQFSGPDVRHLRFHNSRHDWFSHLPNHGQSHWKKLSVHQNTWYGPIYLWIDVVHIFACIYLIMDACSYLSLRIFKLFYALRILTILMECSTRKSA